MLVAALSEKNDRDRVCREESKLTEMGKRVNFVCTDPFVIIYRYLELLPSHL